jgi:hypothetical protein
MNEQQAEKLGERIAFVASPLYAALVAAVIGAVVVIGLVFAISMQANGQEAPTPADSIINPDIILRSTTPKISPMQKAIEKLQMRQSFERDKADSRRQTECI